MNTPIPQTVGGAVETSLIGKAVEFLLTLLPE
jgi:hypothetical protein